MKVALCLSGQPRYLEEGFFYIKKYLLERYDVDVFVHTWWDEKYSNREFIYTNIRRQGFYDPQTVEKINSFYNPKILYLEPQIIFETFTDVDYCGLNPISIPSMFYSIKKSNDLKKEYENKNNFKYDVVIRCRFDIVLVNFNLKFEELDMDKFYVSGEIHLGGQENVPNDQFCLSSSKNMDFYSTLYDNLNIYKNEGHNIFAGEHILKYHLITKGGKKIEFCNKTELLTNAWWQFSNH